jgi:FkbM family methyltransferase
LKTQKLKNHLKVIFSSNAGWYYKLALRRRLTKLRIRWSKDSRLVFDIYPGIKAILRYNDDLTLRAYLEGLDPAIVKTLETYLKPGMVVVDVGANTGLYTLLFSLLVGSKGKVYAFEPVPSLAKRIEENVRLNGATNVDVFNVAAGCRTGSTKLYLSKGGGDGWASLYEWRYAGDKHIDVDVVALDEWVRQYNVDRVDLLKIDVEGAELDVYLGAQNLFKRGTIQAAIVEFNEETREGARTSADDIRNAIAHHGYKWYRLPWSLQRALPVDWSNLGRLCDLMAIKDNGRY